MRSEVGSAPRRASLPAGLAPVLRRVLGPRAFATPSQLGSQAPASYWSEQAKITITGGMPNDGFGYSVALDGNTAVVGAPDKNNGTGAVYVFARSGATWSEQAEITAPDGTAGDAFGSAVALDGNTAVVGAPYQNGNVGAAYVFTRSGTSWSQQAKLTAANGVANDDFGWVVALSVDTALVGTYENYHAAGAAYIFTRSGTSWSQQAKLIAPDGTIADHFGEAVALAGDSAVVGAPFLNNGTGAAYVFVRSGTSWSEQAKFTAPDGAAGDYFGEGVAVSADTVLVGAYGHNHIAGAAYVFTRSGTSWSQQAELTASDWAVNDDFGYRVALEGNTAVVGAPFEVVTPGAAYVFTRSGTTWSQQAKLTPPDGGTYDTFGRVAISGNSILVGDPGQNDATGAAYVFVAPSLATSLTSGTPFQPIIVTGAAFGAGEAVNLYWDSTATPPLTTTAVATDGSFTSQVRVPQATAGAHTLIAVGQTSGVSATASFTVTPAVILSPNHGKPGSVVSMIGLGFGSSETVAALWYPGFKALKAGTSNAVGTVALTFTVPLNATGTSYVVGYGLSSKRYTVAPFTVTALSPTQAVTRFGGDGEKPRGDPSGVAR